MSFCGSRRTITKGTDTVSVTHMAMAKSLSSGFRDRFGNFHPKILAILRDQEEECEKLAGSLYTKGSVIVLMGRTAMDKESYHRVIPRIREDKTLFPFEEPSLGD